MSGVSRGGQLGHVPPRSARDVTVISRTVRGSGRWRHRGHTDERVTADRHQTLHQGVRELSPPPLLSTDSNG